MLRFARNGFRAAADWGLPYYGNRRASPFQLCLYHHHDDHSAAAGVKGGSNPSRILPPLDAVFRVQGLKSYVNLSYVNL